jgi:hypothetical protein
MKYTLIMFLSLYTCVLLASGKKKTKSTSKTATAATATTSSFNATAYRNAIKSNLNETPNVENVDATLLVVSKPIGDDFLNLIGKNVNDINIQNALNAYERDFVVVNLINSQAYILKNAGIVLIFDNSNNLNQINFYLKGSFQDFELTNYLDKLPLNLEFGMSKPEVENLFGKASETLYPANSETVFCNYLLTNKGITLSATYNEYRNTTIEPKLLQVTLTKFNQALTVSTNNDLTASSQAVLESPKPEITSVSEPILKSGTFVNNDLVSLLGLSIYDFKVNNLMATLGNPDEVVPGVNRDSKYIYKSNGIILQFDNLNRLLGFFIIAQSTFMNTSFNSYKGYMPFAISFSDNIKDIESKLGKAAANNFTDLENLWSKHTIQNDLNYNVIINYKNRTTSNVVSDIANLYVSLKRN